MMGKERVPVPPYQGGGYLHPCTVALIPFPYLQLLFKAKLHFRGLHWLI